MPKERQRLNPQQGLTLNVDVFADRYPRGHQVRQFLERAGCKIIYARRLDHVWSNPWQLNLRLPKELEEEFGFSRELMLLATTWEEFQVRSLNTLRDAVEMAIHVDPEAAMVITEDNRTPDKAYEWCSNDFTVFSLTFEEMSTALAAGREGPRITVRKALQRALFGRNFYDESGPDTGERFFGRSTLLHQLRADFVNHRTVGLFGLRKIGKTSLGQQALQRLEAGDVGVYIDLGGERIHKDARHILVTLSERLSRGPLGPSMPNVKWQNSADPDWELEGWITTYLAIAAGQQAGLSDDVQRITGQPPIGLREMLFKS